MFTVEVISEWMHMYYVFNKSELGQIAENMYYFDLFVEMVHHSMFNL